MGSNTKNLDLYISDPLTDGNLYFDFNRDIGDNLRKIDSYAGEINRKLEDGVIQCPSINMGMSNKIQIPEVSMPINLEFEGFNYTNVFGEEGNCDDTRKWSTYNTTISLDSANKVFGATGIKITTTTLAGGLVNLVSKYTLDTTKYYILSAYVKNGNATYGMQVIKESTGGGVTRESAFVTDTTKFTRMCIKIQPSDFAPGNFVGVYVSGSAVGQYGYADGIMLNEISPAEYNLSEDELMANYPYADSYACLTNPYFENRRYNLVRNGNCEEGSAYWKLDSNASVTVENGKLKVTTGITMTGVSQRVPVEPNTDYYISGGLGSNSLLYVIAEGSNLRIGQGVFNTGSNESVTVALINQSIGAGYYDKIMLVEGTTAPTEYKSCDLQRFVVEGQFAKGDKVKIENQKVSGNLNTKHRTLYGKDYEWLLGADFTACKCIRIASTAFVGAYLEGPIGNILVKSNGSLAIEGPVSSGIANNFNLTTTGGGLSVNVPDADTGWMETFNPNQYEVKAFMNGWKTIMAYGGRYVCWVSVVDRTPVPIALTTKATVAGNSATLNVTAGTGTQFVAGDLVMSYNRETGYTSYLGTVSSSTADTITLGGAITVNVGDYIIKTDNGTTLTQLLLYCASNIASGYEGYRLHYRLANPEPITDKNVHIEGEIWELIKGDNYVMVDSGIVLGEVANPATSDTPGQYMGINVYAPPNGWSNSMGSFLRNKAEVLHAIYRNSIFDSWTIVRDNLSTNGVGRAYTLTTAFDPNATYTVDYQIQKTLHAQTFGSLSLSYPQSIISTLEGHSKSLEQKQAKNSVLDSYIDMSMYEQGHMSQWGRFSVNVTGAYHNIFIPMTLKKAFPTISISNLVLNVRDSGGNAIPIANKSIVAFSSIKNKGFSVTFTITDSTLAQYAKDFGCAIGFDWVADCRGRV